MRILALVAVAALALAGCMASTDDSTSTDGPDLTNIPSVSPTRIADPGTDFSGVVVTDHGAPGMHTIRALHGGSAFLEQVGYNALTDNINPGAVGTGWGAAGLWRTYACFAQFAGTGAISIVDIADPIAPVVLSTVDDPLVNGDCQFTDDGNYMLAGAYLAGAEYPDFGEQPICPQGCPAGGGINVWDVHDKSNPVHILYTNTGEYHTLQLYFDPITNATYVIQAYSGNIYRFDPNVPALGLVATVTPMEHDMWLARHPITGQSLLYTGSGGGFIIYDFADPSDPKEIGLWNAEEGAEQNAGWHRQASVDQLIDGMAVVVVAGEDCGKGNSLPYSTVDVSDPTNPITLGTWSVPGNPRSDAQETPAHLCEFSPHEFSVFDGYVAAGNYHAGTWLFDIGSAERVRNPVTLGYHIPATEPLTEEPVFGAQDLTFVWNPFVWGSFFDERGYIIAGDFSSGMYVLKVPGVTQE
ncbi:MAG: hypothetical protein AABX89_04825 [Candidatus Thermoplasmatota archaeon]